MYHAPVYTYSCTQSSYYSVYIYTGSNTGGKDGEAQTAAAVGGAVVAVLVLTVIVHVSVILFRKQAIKKIKQKRY